MAGGWLAAASAATAVGVTATTALGSGITSGATAPLSEQQVASELQHDTPAASGQPGSPAAPAPGAVTRTLGTQGGTVIARCSAGQVTLVSWSPAQGFESEDVHAGPALAARIKFGSHGTDIEVTITCSGAVPVAHAASDRDSHSGRG